MIAPGRAMEIHELMQREQGLPVLEALLRAGLEAAVTESRFYQRLMREAGLVNGDAAVAGTSIQEMERRAGRAEGALRRQEQINKDLQMALTQVRDRAEKLLLERDRARREANERAAEIIRLEAALMKHADTLVARTDELIAEAAEESPQEPPATAEPAPDPTPEPTPEETAPSSPAVETPEAPAESPVDELAVRRGNYRGKQPGIKPEVLRDWIYEHRHGFTTQEMAAAFDRSLAWVPLQTKPLIKKGVLMAVTEKRQVPVGDSHRTMNVKVYKLVRPSGGAVTPIRQDATPDVLKPNFRDEKGKIVPRGRPVGGTGSGSATPARGGRVHVTNRDMDAVLDEVHAMGIKIESTSGSGKPHILCPNGTRLPVSASPSDINAHKSLRRLLRQNGVNVAAPRG